MLRVTRNCPWSRCRFCYGNFYGRRKFELRSLDEIKRDIQSVLAIGDIIRGASVRLGRGGEVDDTVGAAIVRGNPSLARKPSFATVFNWLYSGGRTVFLQDADSLIMRSGELVDVLVYLKTTFPSVQRITSYARAKTVQRKSSEELMALQAAGLSRLHIGLETGDDELLRMVDKGVTAEEHVAAGVKAKESRLELSEYVMPDLGGRELSVQHARNTARVINAIDPDYIRLRPFVPRAETPMYDEYREGRLVLSSPHERLREIRTMVEDLTVSSHLCFDHFANSWRGKSGGHLFRQDYEGYKLPDEKQVVLDLIEEGLALDESAHIHASVLVELPHM